MKNTGFGKIHIHNPRSREEHGAAIYPPPGRGCITARQSFGVRPSSRAIPASARINRLHLAVTMVYDSSMRVAEVEVNKKATIMVNDREYKEFQTVCLQNDESAASVIRECMRRYVAEQKKREKELSKAGQ